MGNIIQSQDSKYAKRTVADSDHMKCLKWLRLITLISLLATACGSGGVDKKQEAANVNSTNVDNTGADLSGNSDVESGNSGSENTGGSWVSGTDTAGVAEPTSSGLIDQAVKNGQLNTETATVYKTYAMFKDPRLPSAYAGEDPGISDPDFLLDAAFNFNILQEKTRDLIAPFLIPPMYSGSWWDLRRNHQIKSTPGKLVATLPCNPLRTSCPLVAGWKYLAGTHINVWYQERYESTDAVKAATILNAIDLKAWPSLTAYMGVEPKSDNGPVIAFEGPDTKMDIALVDMAPLGTTFPSFALKNCGDSSVYILINRSSDVGPTSVHEFMHAIQFAMPLKGCLTRDYKTLMESTANWAVNEVYGTANQWEHQHIYAYTNDISQSILNEVPDRRPYGASLFPLYLTKKEGADRVRQAWVLAGGNFEPQVFEKLVDLDTVWPEFAVRLWNKPPFDDFSRWDAISMKAGKGNTRIQLRLNGKTEDEEVVTPGNLYGLSAHIVRAEFKDSMIRTATFFNGFTYRLSYKSVSEFGDFVAAYPLSQEERKGAHVHAIVKRNGTWESVLRNWTNVPYVNFHRDISGDTVDEVLIIFTNSSSDVKHKAMYMDLPSHIFMSTISTAAPWKGNLNFIDSVEDGVAETFAVNNITFEPLRPVLSAVSEIYTPVELFVIPYQLTEGSATWSISGTNSNGCVYQSGSPITRSLSTGFMPNQLMFYYFIRSGPSLHGFGLGGFDRFPAIQWPYTKKCPDSDPEALTSSGSFMFAVQTNISDSRVSSDGITVSGTGSDTGRSTVTGSWKLTAAKE